MNQYFQLRTTAVNALWVKCKTRGYFGCDFITLVLTFTYHTEQDHFTPAGCERELRLTGSFQ